MTKRFHSCMICLFILLITACGSSDFSVNDRVVYTPDPLFTDFSVPDKALRECLREAINDQKVTSANALSSLSCSDAGIETLAGLSTFTELEKLTLSSNNIVDISELSALTVLQVLYLDNNQIIDAVPLYQLPTLHLVDLSSNPHLLCPASGSLMRVSDVTLPSHCQ
jgi:Leucine-rich repeat (LRR) protein